MRSTIYVKIEFSDGSEPLTEGEKDRFVSLLGDELEFGDLRDQRYHKQGWGMGTSLVVDVSRFKPARSPHPGRDSELVALPSNVLGSSFPDDPKRGRFYIGGVVAQGIKQAVGRRVRLVLTYTQAREILDFLIEYTTKYPNTGTEVEIDVDS